MPAATPGWLAPVRNGATTMWERFEAYDPERGQVNIGNMNSYDHYAFGAVGQWLHVRIADIDRVVDDVGFQRLVFRRCRVAYAGTPPRPSACRMGTSVAPG